MKFSSSHEVFEIFYMENSWQNKHLASSYWVNRKLNFKLFIMLMALWFLTLQICREATRVEIYKENEILDKSFRLKTLQFWNWAFIKNQTLSWMKKLNWAFNKRSFKLKLTKIKAQSELSYKKLQSLSWALIYQKMKAQPLLDLSWVMKISMLTDFFFVDEKLIKSGFTESKKAYPDISHGNLKLIIVSST